MWRTNRECTVVAYTEIVQLAYSDPEQSTIRLYYLNTKSIKEIAAATFIKWFFKR